MRAFSVEKYGRDARATITDAQAAYFKKVLEENEDVRWTLVFIHQLLWRTALDSWNKIEPLLPGREHTVFAGHVHHYANVVREDGTRYFTLATMGGGSSLRGDEFGEFEYITWVTMTGEGPQMTLLKLEGIRDGHVRILESPCRTQVVS